MDKTPVPETFCTTAQPVRRAWSKPTLVAAELSVVTQNGTNITHPNFSDGVTLYNS